MGRNAFARQHDLPSVVIRDADTASVPILPAKDDSPLVVDTDAAKPLQCFSQVLEPVTLDGAKVIGSLGRVQHVELPNRRGSDIRRKPPRSRSPAAIVEILRRGITERQDHPSILSVARQLCNGAVDERSTRPARGGRYAAHLQSTVRRQSWPTDRPGPPTRRPGVGLPWLPCWCRLDTSWARIWANQGRLPSRPCAKEAESKARALARASIPDR